MPSTPVLVCFSHLRWNFVFQRPQHLLSRLARRWRVVVIEEPVHADGEPRLDVSEPMPGVVVLVPRTPLHVHGFDDAQIAHIQPLVTGWLRAQGVADPIVWLYTPMALPMVAPLEPRCLVYDCMDELSAFKGAPRQLQQRERELLRRADVVFTGGPSLYEAKRRLHPNVHCLPSAVDAEHFTPRNLDAGSEQAAAVAALQDAIARPRLGFYGVIDERMDLALIDAVAAARPDWQVIMVGPVVKIDPATLPRRPNIHWLGMQGYERLPHLLAGWDVCLMPFALNESTRFISPTKTLEYLAGEKPVVSTPIHDVKLLYGSVVRIADTPDAFVAACEATLAEPAELRAQRQIEALALVASHSWDQGAASVRRLVEAVLAPPIAAPAVAAADAGEQASASRTAAVLHGTVATPLVSPLGAPLIPAA